PPHTPRRPAVALVVRRPSMLLDEPSAILSGNFGHGSYAEVLVETLSAVKQPFTLGLLGPWGVGKSSVLARVALELRERQCAVVIFDAWRYDSATLRRHLLRDVANGLFDQGALAPAFDREQRLARLEQDEQVPRWHTRPTWAGAGIALLQA